MRVSVEQRLDGLDRLTDPAAMRRVTSKVAQRHKAVMERYVPMDTGALRRSADLGSRFEEGEIVYSTPYAAYQYDLTTGNRTTAGTDGHWDEAAMAAHGDGLAAFAQAALAEELS